MFIAQSKKLLFFHWSTPPFFPPQFCLPIRCGNFSLHFFIHTNCFNHKTLVNDMPCKYRLSMCKKCVGHTQPIYLRFYKFPNNQNIISSLLTTFTHSDSPLLVVAWTHIIYYCLLMKFVNTLVNDLKLVMQSWFYYTCVYVWTMKDFFLFFAYNYCPLYCTSADHRRS